jgi:hypothetical protein
MGCWKRFQQCARGGGGSFGRIRFAEIGTSENVSPPVVLTENSSGSVLLVVEEGKGK